MNKEILEITKKFHDMYEKLASEYTYKTREDTKVFDINSNNGKLMYATVNEIVSPILKENQELKKQYCERTDCSGRLGNSKKVDQLEKELEHLKEIEKEHQRINGELRVENKELLDYKKGYFDLQQENKQLKDNWNELKEYCKNNYYGTTTIGILDKMQELEGKDGEN